LRAWIVTGLLWPLGLAKRQLQASVRQRGELRRHIRGDECEALRQHHTQPVAAQAAHPHDVVAVHHVRAGIFVRLVNQDAADAAWRDGHRKGRVNRVVLGIVSLLLVGELERLAGPRIVDLDVRSFAAAARGVHQLRGPGAVPLGQEANAELFAAGGEDGVLGVGVLGKQAADRVRRPQRSIGVELLTGGGEGERQCQRESDLSEMAYG